MESQNPFSSFEFFKKRSSDITNSAIGTVKFYINDQGRIEVRNETGVVFTYEVSNILGVVNTFTKAQRGILPTIAYAATVTLDFSAANSFSIGVLTGNITLANPTNLPAAGETQSGSIFFKQDATGSRLLTLGANFKWAGGVAGALSTSANAKDRLDYVVDQDGFINVSLAKAIA